MKPRRFFTGLVLLTVLIGLCSGYVGLSFVLVGLSFVLKAMGLFFVIMGIAYIIGAIEENRWDIWHKSETEEDK